MDLIGCTLRPHRRRAGKAGERDANRGRAAWLIAMRGAAAAQSAVAMRTGGSRAGTAHVTAKRAAEAERSERP